MKRNSSGTSSCTNFNPGEKIKTEFVLPIYSRQEMKREARHEISLNWQLSYTTQKFNFFTFKGTLFFSHKNVYVFPWDYIKQKWIQNRHHANNYETSGLTISNWDHKFELSEAISFSFTNCSTFFTKSSIGSGGFFFSSCLGSFTEAISSIWAAETKVDYWLFISWFNHIYWWYKVDGTIRCFSLTQDAELELIHNIAYLYC